VVMACAWLTLRERAMLGDTGASLIGGMIGVLLVTTLSPLGIGLALGVLAAISLYGEFRSISAAIERLPLLDRLDSLGRVN
jgi:UDP-GlcNAc:undecaprenyl-phosphate GlcNAc-1-phosphate transferase